jgi:hypothetical protein
MAVPVRHYSRCIYIQDVELRWCAAFHVVYRMMSDNGRDIDWKYKDELMG